MHAEYSQKNKSLISHSFIKLITMCMRRGRGVNYFAKFNLLLLNTASSSM